MFRNLKKGGERGNFIKEIRNSEKTQTETPRFKNSFGTVLNNGNNIATLLKYKFLALGDYFGKKEQNQFCNNARATVTNLYSSIRQPRRYLIYSLIQMLKNDPLWKKQSIIHSSLGFKRRKRAHS